LIPWEHLDTATVPGTGEELRLMRRGHEFSIRLGRAELMNSRLSGSEEALATLALRRIAGRSRPHVLIGGLGMGFTLRAALHELAADGAVTVVELVPEVVAWARGPMAELHKGTLEDPRVDIRIADVVATIAAARSQFDAILLDVDNGPDAMTSAGNDRLYDPAGLAAALAALRTGGVLAVWSVAPDDRFGARLSRAGFAAEQHRVRASRTGKGARHTIWIATKT
jgi:spermidine synthase